MASASPQATAVRGARLPYLPGLDGLRAIAVLAVLLYHAEIPWMPGGFLGVEVFFVISGYLITSLLLAEWDEHARLNLKAFWLRRARRLLPALFLMLAATLAFAVAFLPEETAGLRGDAVAAIGYVTNWYLIFSHTSYFEMAGRPSLLRHLWSLAVEEQFYVLWPLLFTVGMRTLRRRGTLVAALAGALASGLLMAALYQPEADPSRIYYGTDTRASGLLIGGALALAWAPWRRPPQPGRARAVLLDLLGLSGLAALLGLFLHLDEFQPFLYQGGFAVVALATAATIAAAVDPAAHLAAGWLGRRLLRWIGLRSYGIYLWHWPIFMITRPQLDVALEGWPLLALRLVATLLCAEFSYRYVEMPIRNGALGRLWETWRTTQGVPFWRVCARWAGALGTLLAFGILGESVVAAQPPPPPSYLAVEAIHTVNTVTTPAPAALPASRASVVLPLVQADAAPTPTPAMTAQASVDVLQALTTAEELSGLSQPRPTPPPSPTPIVLPAESFRPVPTSEPLAGPIIAIGDSVMVSAADELERAIPGVQIDAAIGRQVSAAIRLLKQLHDAGQLGDAVIIHVGNNGVFSAKQFDEIMGVLAGVRRVVFVNVKVPHRWGEPNNTVLAEGVARYANAVLVDWHAASADQPDLFWKDGIHLRPEGAQLYAALIAAALGIHS
jgi:peptidoglycan/LPS O-acetylase OafA/YrhL